MKKRTKIELVIFVIAAVMLILGMLRDMPSKPEPAQETSIASVIELPAVPDITETEAPEGTSAAVTEIIQQNSTEGSSEEVPLITQTETVETDSAVQQKDEEIREDGEYTDKEHVALYLHTYGHLPSNYITKEEARDAGWDSQKGNLNKVCPGMSIGGDHFGNYEGLLPKKKGRKYYECDIDYNTKKGSRGAKRIIYSSDGLIYYTGDHYESFELMYGEP